MSLSARRSVAVGHGSHGSLHRDAGRENLYTSYLPWAVAFGCADQWAAKFQIETGQPPPLPSYFNGNGDDLRQTTGMLPIATMVDDFDTTVGKAISAYAATQVSSSSSSSSGFSGGGGGGGGGGGSW